jgi:sulfate adenylyltransferase subunit 2
MPHKELLRQHCRPDRLRFLMNKTCKLERQRPASFASARFGSDFQAFRRVHLNAEFPATVIAPRCQSAACCGIVILVLVFPKSMKIPNPPSHLVRLEAESIHIMREVVAQFARPVMLYSIGKDSSVMLHLAMKAFWPSKPPFPLLHIDTTWKFKEMIAFRDRRTAELGLDLIVHINQEGLRAGIGPFTHGSAIYTDVMKTDALKQALDSCGFDAAFGGARRDEEKSRAKERVFSFRTAGHHWDPRNQRPELWRLYNGRIQKGETVRVFPLANWTELDVWQYVEAEDIPVVPLYFAKSRPVIERDGYLILVDDDRLELRPEEQVVTRTVRFRTLGCYPLTGGVESNAQTVQEVIAETLVATTSERRSRIIDHDQDASMERKKRTGYF